jgi:hypothetical protein
MKQTVVVLSVLLIALAPSGCTSTVTREALLRKATRNSLTLSPDTTYYCGSRGGYDYFYIQPSGPTTFRISRRLRVPERQNTVSNRFDYTTEQSRWRVVVGLDPTRRDPEPAASPASAPKTLDLPQGLRPPKT